MCFQRPSTWPSGRTRYEVPGYGVVHREQAAGVVAGAGGVAVRCGRAAQRDRLQRHAVAGELALEVKQRRGDVAVAEVQEREARPKQVGDVPFPALAAVAESDRAFGEHGTRRRAGGEGARLPRVPR